MQMQDSLAPQIVTLAEAMAKLQASIDVQSSLQTKPVMASTNFDSVKVNAGIQDTTIQTLAITTGSKSTKGNPLGIKSVDESISTAQRLNEVAAKVHSNASVISNARSTVWGGSERLFTVGSEWGEPLSPTVRETIEKWLSQPRHDDIAENHNNSKLVSGTLEASVSSCGKTSSSKSKDTELDDPHSESDDDDKLEYSVVRKLLTKADAYYNHGQFEEAENIYRYVCKRSKAFSVTKRTMLLLKTASLQLACACFQQRKLNAAKTILLELVQECSIDDNHAYLILEASYVLGQVFVLQGDYKNAELHCKRTVLGRWRLLGKDNKETHAAIQLLVLTYSSGFSPKEWRYDAEAWSEMLPPELRGKRCELEILMSDTDDVVRSLRDLRGYVDPDDERRALAFRNFVYYTNHKQAHIWMRFYEIMKDFSKTDGIGRSVVVDKVMLLFQDKPQLIEGFKKFLPAAEMIHEASEVPENFTREDIGQHYDAHGKGINFNTGKGITTSDMDRRRRVIAERYRFRMQRPSTMVYDMGTSLRSLYGHFVVSKLVHDGEEVLPNIKIKQIWTLRNRGPSPWPAGCYVHFDGGDAVLEPGDVCSDPINNVVSVGEEVSFSAAITVPERPGKAVSYWRLSTAEGVDFGYWLWCDVVVTDLAHRKRKETRTPLEEAEGSQMTAITVPITTTLYPERHNRARLYI